MRNKIRDVAINNENLIEIFIINTNQFTGRIVIITRHNDGIATMILLCGVSSWSNLEHHQYVI